MVYSTALPATLSSLYAGELVKAWVFCCCECHAYGLDMSAIGDTMKTDAMARARTSGWSKTKAGWLCPACKTKARAT